MTRQDCLPLIIDVHYAGRSPSVTFAFGLFDDSELEGIITYGTPFSSTLRTGLAGKDYAPHVLELNRLALYNNRKNHASFLIGRSLKMLGGNRIIISYSDTAQGHIGTVYQATNFHYVGLSPKRTDWAVKGQEHLHNCTITDQFRGVPNRAQAARDFYGADFYLKPRPRKHRYVTLIGSKPFKRDAMAALKYPIGPYPKE